jgi:hypothetical protein
MRATISAIAAFLLLAQAVVLGQGGQYRTLNDRFPGPAFTSRAEWDARAAYPRGPRSTRCSSTS